jgi:hypothetical protein
LVRSSHITLASIDGETTGRCAPWKTPKPKSRAEKGKRAK